MLLAFGWHHLIRPRHGSAKGRQAWATNFFSAMFVKDPTRQRQNHHRKSEGNSLYYHLCIDYIDYVDTYSCYLYIHSLSFVGSFKYWSLGKISHMSDVFKKGGFADTEISEPLQSTKKMGYSANWIRKADWIVSSYQLLAVIGASSA